MCSEVIWFLNLILSKLPKLPNLRKPEKKVENKIKNLGNPKQKVRESSPPLLNHFCEYKGIKS
jgi:hypothetical protein